MCEASCVGRAEDRRDAGSAGEMHGVVACNCHMDCGKEWVWKLMGAKNCLH